MSDVHVQVKDSSVIGECTACNRLSGIRHQVWEVRLNNTTIRLCDDCRLDLAKKLKTPRHVLGYGFDTW